MLNNLTELKKISIVLISAGFLVAATPKSCNDNSKKEEKSEQMSQESDEHPTNSDHEHPANSDHEHPAKTSADSTKKKEGEHPNSEHPK